MKTFVGLGLAGLLTILAGCASSASPQFIRGHYYMTGDSKCQYTKPLSATSVECYDGNQRWTGNRYALTDQQLQMYRHQQAMNQQMLMQTAVQRPIQCTNIMGIVNCY